MKSYFLFLLTLTSICFSQTNSKFNYQFTAFDAKNELLVNKNISVKISLIEGSVMGTEIYNETHSIRTNSNGLISLIIGSGKSHNGSLFTINWKKSKKFIKIEIDELGENNYSIKYEPKELLSVPYALHSLDNNLSGFKHYLGELFDGGIIYYLYKGEDQEEHGLIVSVTQTTSQWTWETAPKYLGAERVEDGAFNTSLMDTEAYNPITSFIKDIGGKNWYLPSIDELQLINSYRYNIQKSLRANNLNKYVGLFVDADYYNYWSSTELDADIALSYSFTTGNIEFTKKKESGYVCWIKSF